MKLPFIEENEAKLIQHIREGDRTAPKKLYCRYIRYLTAVCSRYITCEDDIKDVLQESFVKILTTIGKFEYRGEGSLKAWMTRIVVNESLQTLKRSQSFETFDPDWDRQDDDDIETEEIPTEAIHEMIRNLPVGYRTVFNLYVLEKKSHKEIASILKIKESSSASQLHRAKEMLAKQISDYKSLKECL
jgi:RNA polymerase sigma factor (sigma-70 family)